MTKLKLSNGTLAYHIRVLLREEHIKCRKNGKYKIFFPYKMNITKETMLTLPTSLIPTQRDILEHITSRPGINQKQLVEATAQTKPMVSMHLKAMAARGYIIAERLGRTMIYYINVILTLVFSNRDSS